MKFARSTLSFSTLESGERLHKQNNIPLKFGTEKQHYNSVECEQLHTKEGEY